MFCDYKDTQNAGHQRKGFESNLEDYQHLIAGYGRICLQRKYLGIIKGIGKKSGGHDAWKIWAEKAFQKEGSDQQDQMSKEI